VNSSEEESPRLACDASRVIMTHATDARVLNLGWAIDVMHPRAIGH